jgi:hypothetical protein
MGVYLVSPVAQLSVALAACRFCCEMVLRCTDMAMPVSCMAGMVDRVRPVGSIDVGA